MNTFAANNGEIYPSGLSGYVPADRVVKIPNVRANLWAGIRLADGKHTRTKGRIVKRICRKTYKQRHR